MKTYRIVDVAPLAYPTVRVVFEDGMSGDLDLSRDIDGNRLFAPLRDAGLFQQVAVAKGGRAFGWRLDRLGEEIELAADQARTDAETQIVHELAERYRSHRAAAE